MLQKHPAGVARPDGQEPDQGFARTGNGLDRAISREIDQMTEAGQIESVGDNLRPVLATVN